MAGKTAAVIGTGQIGAIVARLLWHLRCEVLAVDPHSDDFLIDLGVRYVDLEEALACADIVTLNCPLTDRDASPDRRRPTRVDEGRRDARQHRTWRAHRHRMRCCGR